MNILVTGGAGFIGANFLNLLVPRHPEHHFVNLDKLTYAGNPLSLAAVARATNYTFERGDIADRDTLDRVFESHQPELVVHFAAESHVDRSILGPGEFVRTNIQGTFELLEACRRHGHGSPALFHHVSTDEVYGSLGDEGAFSESSRYDPSSPYSASKAASDHLVRAWARTYQQPVKITNCSNNYGPYQFPEKLIPLMIHNCLTGEPLPIYGQGLNVRDWLFVADHCEAIWLVAERGATGATYNIGGGAELPNIALVDTLITVVANEANLSLETLLSQKTFVADRPGHDHRYAIDASKIHHELGWSPRESLDSGLRKTVRWYLDHPDWIEQIRSGSYREWIATNYGDRGEA